MQVDEASASIIWRRRAEPHPSGSRILEEVKSSGLRQLCSSCRSSLVSCKWDRSRGGNPSHLQHNKDTFVNLGAGGNKVFKSCRPQAFLQTESTKKKKKTAKKRLTSSTLLWVIQLKCLPQCFWQPTWAPAPKENVFSRSRTAVAESKKLRAEEHLEQHSHFSHYFVSKRKRQSESTFLRTPVQWVHQSQQLLDKIQHVSNKHFTVFYIHVLFCEDEQGMISTIEHFFFFHSFSFCIVVNGGKWFLSRVAHG